MNGGCMHDSVLVIFYFFLLILTIGITFKCMVVFKFAKLELVHKTVYSLIPMQHSTSYQTVKDRNLSGHDTTQ